MTSTENTILGENEKITTVSATNFDSNNSNMADEQITTVFASNIDGKNSNRADGQITTVSHDGKEEYVEFKTTKKDPEEVLKAEYSRMGKKYGVIGWIITVFNCSIMAWLTFTDYEYYFNLSVSTTNPFGRSLPCKYLGYHMIMGMRRQS